MSSPGTGPRTPDQGAGTGRRRHPRPAGRPVRRGPAPAVPRSLRTADPADSVGTCHVTSPAGTGPFLCDLTRGSTRRDDLSALRLERDARHGQVGAIVWPGGPSVSG